jgi:hypothetical protein
MDWWAGIKPYRILIACHYLGARSRGESGGLRATAEGLFYKPLLGSKVTIPWNVIQDIEVTTESKKRVTAGRAVAIGIFSLAARKNETFTYIHVQDANTVWSFAAKTTQVKVLAAMKPVLDAFQGRTRTQTQAEIPHVQQQLSVADELAKLANLRDSGVLSEDEFSTEKAKLLGNHAPDHATATNAQNETPQMRIAKAIEIANATMTQDQIRDILALASDKRGTQAAQLAKQMSRGEITPDEFKRRAGEIMGKDYSGT